MKTKVIISFILFFIFNTVLVFPSDFKQNWRRANIEWNRKDAVPAPGRAYFATDEPIVAGLMGTVHLIYETGKNGLQKGATILVAAGVAANQALEPVQSDDPSGAGYVTVSSNLDNVRFNIKCTNIVLIELADGSLREGDKIDIKLGDKSQGGAGYQYSTRSNRNWRFTVAVDVEGNGEFKRVKELPTKVVIGGDAVKLSAYAKANPDLNSYFNVTLVAFDAFDNPSHSYRGSVAFSSPNDNIRLPSMYTFSKADEGHHTFPVSVSEEGIFFIDIEDEVNGMKCRTNPVVPNFTGSDYKLYFGDIHSHTSESDGYGSIQENYEWARDIRNLDFTSLSDHAEASLCGETMNDVKMQRQWDAARFYNNTGNFVTLLGNEWTDWNKYGNHNVYFLEDDQPLLGCDIPGCETLEGLISTLGEREYFIVPHHTRICIDWNNFEYKKYPSVFPIMEICSHWGSNEWQKGRVAWARKGKGDVARTALAMGIKFGFIGSSDNHQGRPGGWIHTHREDARAVVFAKNLTRKDIFEAMKNRRTYATTGKHILLDVKINGHMMGEEFQSDEPRKIEVRVVGETNLRKVEIIKNGEVLYQNTGADSDISYYRIEWHSQKDLNWGGSLKNLDGDFFEVQPYYFDKLEGLQSITDREISWTSTTNELEGDVDGFIFGVKNKNSKVQLQTEIKSFDILLKDLENSPLEYVDDSEGIKIIIQKEDTPLNRIDASFIYVDNEKTKTSDTDYYYVRITQVDDNFAFSSPIWVN